MALSTEDILAKFPTKNLPRIEGEPNYQSINECLQALYGNAALIPTTLGGGAHGHIGLIMPGPLYATLSVNPYVAPADPGAQPNIPAGTNAALREQLREQHRTGRKIYDTHTNINSALKALLLKAVDDAYVCKLKNRLTGYLGVTTRDLLDHLLDRYRKITLADMVECQKALNEPLDPSLPIDVYFKKIDDTAQYAADGNTPFTPEQILQAAYHAVSSTGLYIEPCKQWRRRTAVDKMWPNFKIYFGEEYHDLKETQRITAGQGGYHGANAATDIVIDLGAALDNLALAASADKNIVKESVRANKQLTDATKLLSEANRTPRMYGLPQAGILTQEPLQE